MNKMDILYDSLSNVQKKSVSKEEFFQAILYYEFQKLQGLGLHEEKPLRDGEIKDMVFNKIKVNYNNIIPNHGDRCMYLYCRERSIRASHVISEVFLRNICGSSGKRANVLYTPIPNLNLNKLIVTSIGVGKAFRFPGFCERHENWFEFEKESDITTDFHHYKQVYRSLCYEEYLQTLFIKKERLGYDLIVEKIREKASQFISENSILELSLTKFENAQTKMFKRHTLRSIKARKSLIQELRAFKNQVWTSIKTDEGLVASYEIKLNILVPLAFTHCGVINISNSKKDFRIIGAMILIPLDTGSLVMFCAPKKYKGKLKQLWKSFSDTTAFETLIYNSMSLLTDNWLVNPEFWDTKLSSGLKEKILSRQSLLR
jgi:hypothetical protein